MTNRATPAPVVVSDGRRATRTDIDRPLPTIRRGLGCTTDGVYGVSVSVAARMLGASINTLWRGVWDGSIPSYKVGKRTLIPVAAIEARIDGKSVTSDVSGDAA